MIAAEGDPSVPRRLVLQGWRPAALRAGTDPDPRFTLANERTFLAWIRTALGFVAAALALEALSGHLLDAVLRRVLVCTILAFAVLLTGAALHRWLRIEIAMRTRKPLPLPGIAVLVVGLVFGAAVTIAIVTVS